MNIEQYLAFMEEIAVGLLSPPVHPFKEQWKKIYEEMKPHFYGQVPPVLEVAFPNEEPNILNYRKATYQAKTESPLVKAITELNRLLSSAKHSIQFENMEMQTYLNEKMFGDHDLVRYFFNIFIPNRILDPNAVLLVNPVNIVDETQKIDVELAIIPSDRIVFNDPDYKLLIYKGINKKKYSTFALQQPLWYHVVTDEFYAEIKSIDGKSELTVLYQHDSGMMPWITLGGRAVPMYDIYGNSFTIYKSDFSPAIPYLNDAAIFDNQHKSVMLSTCFPIKFVEGVDCHSCHGVGYVMDKNDHDHTISCNTCHGHGKILSISPLAAYNINPTTNRFPDANANTPVDPIRFYSPDTSTIELTKTVANESLMKAENVLNLNRTINSVQSGVAKELDRESEYIEIGKISDDVYAKLEDLLYIIQGLDFMDTESLITVNKPISFDLKSETELLAEFTASQKGQPAAIRYEAYRNYMDRRFSSDAVARQIADICAMYTSIYLYTPEEIQVMIGTGSITQEDAVKATFVFDAVTTLYYVENYDIMTNDFNAINQQLDRILAPKLESAQSVVIPEQIDFNDTLIVNNDSNNDSNDDSNDNDEDNI